MVQSVLLSSISYCLIVQEVETKDKDLVKVKMELKTLGLAAKEGVEAATKVKALEAETKRLGEENVTLTKNFESERVRLGVTYYYRSLDKSARAKINFISQPNLNDKGHCMTKTGLSPSMKIR